VCRSVSLLEKALYRLLMATNPRPVNIHNAICNAICNYMMRFSLVASASADSAFLFSLLFIDNKAPYPINNSTFEDPTKVFSFIATAMVTCGCLWIDRVPVALITLELRLPVAENGCKQTNPGPVSSSRRIDSTLRSASLDAGHLAYRARRQGSFERLPLPPWP
jgi:hypothetical protein